MTVPKKPLLLLVDDDDTIRDALVAIFHKSGFEVTTAVDGKRAQELLAQSPFDALISDIRMPGSTTSGIDLLIHSKLNYPKLPVIMMTGFASVTEIDEAHGLGADVFLAKPFRKSEILAALQAVLPAPAPASPESPPPENSDYGPLAIEEFIAGRQLPYEIFIKLGNGHFVKIAHQGEDINDDRIRTLRERGIHQLFLKAEDLNKLRELKATRPASGSGTSS